MNGETLCWVLVERDHADDPHPELGANLPHHAVYATRELADEAARQASTEVVVAELIDRRAS